MLLNGYLTWTIGLPGSSHAEATLAGGSDVAIGFDFVVVEAGIKDIGTSTTGDENGLVDFRGGHLVGNGGTVKGGAATDDDGEQESEDGVLHDITTTM
jgi:hypothetical protein